METVPKHLTPLKKEFLYALILFFLLGARLSFHWERNRNSVYLTNALIYSPYKCLVEPSLCNNVQGAKASVFEWASQNIAGANVIVLKKTGDVELNTSGAETKYWDLRPNWSPLASLVRGGLFLQSENQAEALVTWRQEPAIASYLASLADQIDDSSRAVEVNNLSIAVNPTVEAYLQLGQRHFELRNYEEAREALLHSAALLETSSGNLQQRHGPFVFLYLGHAYRHLGEFEFARNNYEKALVLKQNWEGAILGLAEVDLALNDVRMARHRLEELVAQNSRSPIPHYRLVLVHLELGDLLTARRISDELV
ncbi:MAG: tetratricopeptide repeat protein, partial [Chloroflexi bacterium]|nr:tetratricopeptide repeat protein [Chloroflexota bacterium]